LRESRHALKSPSERTSGERGLRPGTDDRDGQREVVIRDVWVAPLVTRSDTGGDRISTASSMPRRCDRRDTRGLGEEGRMHARLSRFAGLDPERIDATVRQFEEEPVPRLERQSGF
jgi:hypothetical protein